jgi:hypothetical protein
MMNQLFSKSAWTLIALFALQQLQAQVIPFSMEEETTQQNTPEGWTPVDLPKGLPTLTVNNTFYINDDRFGATTTATDNTQAIQAALDAVPTDGGMVVIPAGTWKFCRIQLKSRTILHLCAGATLELIPYSEQVHNSKVPYITNKNGATDIVVEGEGNTSIIEGQGAPWWDAVEQKEEGLQRGSLIRFESGSRFLFRHFRMQNAPSTNLTLGNSGRGTHNTVHHVSIYAPASHDVPDPSHNTDGIPIWAAYANIYDCDIDTGDDNVVTDSNAQYIHVWNCHFKAGHGASLGSYTVNMHDIIYENITFDGTDCGFRLKSNTDRSGDVYNLVFRNCTLTSVMNPIMITAWYDQLPESPASAAASPSPTTATTPIFHDIFIKDITVKGYNTMVSSPKNGYGIFIYGRPESLVRDVTFDNVQIEHGKGLKMNFCEGVQFINNCSYKNTKTGAQSTAESVADLIEEQYECSYSWNGFEPEVVLSAATSTSVKDDYPFVFNGGYTITNTSNKKYAAGNINTIKYSADATYTINLPEGKTVSDITFAGYSNYDGGSYLSEVQGVEYSSTDYAFVYKNKDTGYSLETKTIHLPSPATDKITFTIGNKQACFIIKLQSASSPTAIKGISTSRRDIRNNADGWYSLDGQQFQSTPTRKGLYIHNGRKVIIRQ